MPPSIPLRYPDPQALEQAAAAAKRDDYKPVVKNGVIQKTFCNAFVHGVAVSMGCREFYSQPHGRVMLANEMVAYLKGPTSRRWVPLYQKWLEVQARANAGELVVIGRAAAGHGHVCVAVPGERAWSGTWGKLVCRVANVGKSNFTHMPLSFAFTVNDAPEVLAWAWRGPEITEERIV